MNPDFEPQKAFRLIDSRGVDTIDKYDLTNFIRSQHVNCQLEEGMQIILEFDSTRAGSVLAYDDFCQMVLP
jgi:Ca2+-binding EF-hand superfamily protein